MRGDNYPQFNEESYTSEEAIKFLTEAQMYISLKKAVRRWGLERTEDKIKEIYQTTPKLRDYLLKILHDIWKHL